MATANETYGWYKDFFDKKGIHYDEDVENSNIRVEMPIDGKLQKTNMFLLCRDTYIIVKAFVMLNADEDVRQNVAEYIIRASYGLTYGSFELDLSDGEVSYKLTLDCEDRSSLSDDVLLKTFTVPQMMLGKYGDGLLAVMFKVKSPEEAIDDIEGEVESGCCCGHDHDDD